MSIRFVHACNYAYAAQGLALYRSLQQHMSGAWAMVWCPLDWKTFELLSRTLGHASETHYVSDPRYGSWADTHPIHDSGDRPGEWFWQWAARSTASVIESMPESTIVYVDSDCWFLDDPTPAIRSVEEAGADIGQQTHQFPPHRMATHGDRGGWWVGFNVFRPTIRAAAAAAWWSAWVRRRCILTDPGDEYLEIPPGLAGDQPPLHAFHRLARVHEITTPGFVASWNADALQDRSAYDRITPWLWHGHEYRFDLSGECTKETAYPVPAWCRKQIVDPWKEAVQAAAKELAA